MARRPIRRTSKAKADLIGQRGDRLRQKLFDDREAKDRDQLSFIELEVGRLFPGWYAQNQDYKNVAELTVNVLEALRQDAKSVMDIPEPTPDMTLDIEEDDE